jgi:hypothetical protein
LVVVPALDPSVVPEPARSSAPLPVELDEPSAVPVPVVPDRLPPVLLAAPCAVVVPGVVPSVLLLPGVVLFRPGAPKVPVPGAVATPEGLVHGVVEAAVEPDVDWASATPAAAANTDAVASIANVFLLVFMLIAPCG